VKLLAWRTSARLLALGVQDRRMVAPKVGLPLLEAATMEYDDRLHILWANLLASALNPASAPVERWLVSILADLTGDDARALESLYAEALSADCRPFRNWGGVYGPDVDSPSFGAAEADNLRRLGLIDLGDTAPVAPIVMTTLGVAFCCAAGIQQMPQAAE
jgi:hypothetical protein